MNQAAFASLIGVSGPMVSKYGARGLLARTDAGDIDPLASLDLLQGHLSDDKHAKAMSLLGHKAAATAAAGQAGGRPPAAKTGKALKDDIEAEMKALDLAERKGELVLAAEVDDRARDAVAIFRESRANARREIAEKLCAQFGIASDRVSAVTRFLAQEDEIALGAFARTLVGMIERAATSEAAQSDVQASA
jgi:hypothetical protein